MGDDPETPENALGDGYPQSITKFFVEVERHRVERRTQGHREKKKRKIIRSISNGPCGAETIPALERGGRDKLGRPPAFGFKLSPAGMPQKRKTPLTGGQPSFRSNCGKGEAGEKLSFKTKTQGRNRVGRKSFFCLFLGKGWKEK